MTIAHVHAQGAPVYPGDVPATAGVGRGAHPRERTAWHGGTNSVPTIRKAIAAPMGECGFMGVPTLYNR